MKNKKRYLVEEIPRVKKGDVAALAEVLGQKEMQIVKLEKLHKKIKKRS